MPGRKRRRQTPAPNVQLALPFDGKASASGALSIPLVSARDAAEPISLEARRRRRR